MKKGNFVLLDKKSIFIDEQAQIGENVIIYENNRIDGDSVIGDNVTIFPNSFIVNSIIGKGAKIYSSFIENSRLGQGCIVGPFSHLKRVVAERGAIISACSEIKNKKIFKAQFNKNSNEQE